MKQGLWEGIEEQTCNKQAAAITVKEQKHVEFEGRDSLPQSTLAVTIVPPSSTVPYYEEFRAFQQILNYTKL
jgi:hypothetical protein